MQYITMNELRRLRILDDATSLKLDVARDFADRLTIHGPRAEAIKARRHYRRLSRRLGLEPKPLKPLYRAKATGGE